MSIILKENEKIEDLEYKGLRLIQNKSEFCFGIDSILLTNFAKDIKKNSIVLDLGTGTGIISVLLCEKTELKKIIGIEIQNHVFDIAQRNIRLNKLENKFSVINENIKNLDKVIEKNSIDAIVTNPPYKKLETGLKNNNKAKLISRHEVECNLEDIIKISSSLLKDRGAFYMVHKPERLTEIVNCLNKYKLEPKIVRFVYPKEDKDANLILIKAIKNGKSFLKICKPLIIYNKDGSYSKEILQIYNKNN